MCRNFFFEQVEIKVDIARLEPENLLVALADHTAQVQRPVGTEKTQAFEAIISRHDVLEQKLIENALPGDCLVHASGIKIPVTGVAQPRHDIALRVELVIDDSRVKFHIGVLFLDMRYTFR